MFGICVEASHRKGMGHLFRMLNFIEFIKTKKEDLIVFINNDSNSIGILNKKNIKYEVVDLEDVSSQWENSMVRKYNIRYWINDRLNTDIEHVKTLKKNNVKVISFDDYGTGKELIDLNFCPLLFERQLEVRNLNNTFVGIDYLILNKEINKFKRIRNTAKNILVTLGGSDTYGVTIKIIEILKKMNQKATIILGPSFSHYNQLNKVLNDNFIVRRNVKSLIEEFYKYDLAITGGGITPFEANACGLPCIIIANEIHEIENAKYLHSLQSSIFAGYYKDIDVEKLNLKVLNIKDMSLSGIYNIKTDGIENIYKKNTR